MSIPNYGWDRLVNLSNLNLSNARFAGKIPVGIFRLTKLTFLDLSYFHGEFGGLSLTSKPIFLRNMSSLRELHLDYVDLLPYQNEWCGALANFTPALEILSMIDCSLFGATPENQFKGVFPKQIFLLKNLQHLDISENPMLFGSLPKFSDDRTCDRLVIVVIS
ncbi:hypothetical protein IEQ34_000386 [Dendrobium chrysotoxum]|uniref:Uncharacterized protein n=1 Tax=Dendrobium chrysotoxum TaxID=161865 RepID=A0AAV7HSR0_DENCH|nr:hypothetical protein IEQ34_000386 [Dendrobium chrysotoxum]